MGIIGSSLLLADLTVRGISALSKPDLPPAEVWPRQGLRFTISPFEGDASDFYTACVDEINLFEIEDLSYEWAYESRSAFKPDEPATLVLCADNGLLRTGILAYPFASTLQVQTTHDFVDEQTRIQTIQDLKVDLLSTVDRLQLEGYIQCVDQGVLTAAEKQSGIVEAGVR